MEDKLQPYRQPMVTATGIILGFILNFASSWVKSDSLLSDTMAYIVGFCVLLGIICFILVLSRILSLSYPKDQFESYYTRTLRLFIAGICLAFGGAIIDMFANFWHS